MPEVTQRQTGELGFRVTPRSHPSRSSEMRSPPAILGHIFLMKTGSTEASREARGPSLPVAWTTGRRLGPGVSPVPPAPSPLTLPAWFLGAGAGEAHSVGVNGAGRMQSGDRGPTAHFGLPSSRRKNSDVSPHSSSGSESTSDVVGGYPTDRAPFSGTCFPC